jgi:hypothetical protein
MVNRKTRFSFSQDSLRFARRSYLKGTESVALLETNLSVPFQKGKPMPKDCADGHYLLRFNKRIWHGYQAELRRTVDDTLVKAGVNVRSALLGAKVFDAEQDVEIYLKLVGSPLGVPGAKGMGKVYAMALHMLTFGYPEIDSRVVIQSSLALPKLKDPEEIADALYTLGKGAIAGFRQNLRSTLADIANLVRHTDKFVRQNAVWALTECGKAGLNVKPYADAIIGAQSDRSEKVAANARRAVEILSLGSK